MNIKKIFDTAFRNMSERGWDRLYIMIDIHGTIFYPSYEKEEQYRWYPWAKEALQKLSERPDLKLILWSSSYISDITKYEVYMKLNNINFDYINENPEINSNKLSDFSKKFYFNIGLDDKCGFDAEQDWLDIYNYIK